MATWTTHAGRWHSVTGQNGNLVRTRCEMWFKPRFGMSDTPGKDICDQCFRRENAVPKTRRGRDA